MKLINFGSNLKKKNLQKKTYFFSPKKLLYYQRLVSSTIYSSKCMHEYTGVPKVKRFKWGIHTKQCKFANQKIMEKKYCNSVFKQWNLHQLFTTYLPISVGMFQLIYFELSHKYRIDAGSALWGMGGIIPPWHTSACMHVFVQVLTFVFLPLKVSVTINL